MGAGSHEGWGREDPRVGGVGDAGTWCAFIAFVVGFTFVFGVAVVFVVGAIFVVSFGTAFGHEITYTSDYRMQFVAGNFFVVALTLPGGGKQRGKGW